MNNEGHRNFWGGWPEMPWKKKMPKRKKILRKDRKKTRIQRKEERKDARKKKG